MRNGEFLEANTSASNYLITDLIPSRQVVLVAGLPGDGKTFFSLATAYHVAYGADFLNRKTAKGSVLIIDGENPKSVLTNRINKIKRGLKDDGYIDHADIDIQHYPNFLLDDKRTWFNIVKVIQEIKPVLILIDHLRCFHTQDENSSKGMELVASKLIELVNICGSTVIVLHHFGKGNGSFYKRLRGSSVIYARSEAAFEIRALNRNSGKLESFGLIPQARKEKLTPPIIVILEEDEEHIRLKYDAEYEPVDDPVLDKLGHRVAHIFLQDQRERTVNDVKDILAGMGSDNETREVLRALERKGVLEVRVEGRSHKFVYSPMVSLCPWCNERYS